ncbi:MAG: hypothetical protein HQ553_12335 [Chloroflexi bacterium]|nr:hypothetical protein [Chloroflexota bacterium]
MTNNINGDIIYDRTGDISRKKSLVRVLRHLKMLAKKTSPFGDGTF